MLLLVCSFIISLVLKFTSTQESSLAIITTILSFIILFSGGFISGAKGKQRGWLIGLFTGVSYSLIIFLFQFLGYDQLFSWEQSIYHICYIVTAMMGGILGVNLNSANQRNT